MSTSFEAESHKSPETLEQEIDAKRASISHLVDSLNTASPRPADRPGHGVLQGQRWRILPEPGHHPEAQPGAHRAPPAWAWRGWR